MAGTAVTCPADKMARTVARRCCRSARWTPQLSIVVKEAVSAKLDPTAYLRPTIGRSRDKWAQLFRPYPVRIGTRRQARLLRQCESASDCNPFKEVHRSLPRLPSYTVRKTAL